MMRPLKLYLAGPMTGIPQFNFPAFDEAAAALREQGIEIVSPAELDSPEVRDQALADDVGNSVVRENGVEMTWGDFLARDVKIVADEVDGVVTLPNWWRSKGARLEVFVALCGDKPVYAYRQPNGFEPRARLSALDPVSIFNLIQENML